MHVYVLGRSILLYITYICSIIWTTTIGCIQYAQYYDLCSFVLKTIVDYSTRPVAGGVEAWHIR